MKTRQTTFRFTIYSIDAASFRNFDTYQISDSSLNKWSVSLHCEIAGYQYCTVSDPYFLFYDPRNLWGSNFFL